MAVVDTDSVIWNPDSDYLSTADSTLPKEDHLSIQDVDLATSVPVGGIRGWDDDFLQAVPICYSQLSFDYMSAFNSAAFESEELYARRLSKVIAGAVFTDTGATAVVYMFLKDATGLFTLVGSETLTATAIQDENLYYVAVSKIFDTYGADTVKFYVAAPSAGEVSFRMAVV